MQSLFRVGLGGGNQAASDSIAVVYLPNRAALLGRARR